MAAPGSSMPWPDTGILVKSGNKTPTLLPSRIIWQWSLSTYWVPAQTPTMCHDKCRESWLQFLINKKQFNNHLYSFSESSLQTVFFPLKAPRLHDNLGVWGQFRQALPARKTASRSISKQRQFLTFPKRKGWTLLAPSENSSKFIGPLLQI